MKQLHTAARHRSVPRHPLPASTPPSSAGWPREPRYRRAKWPASPSRAGQTPASARLRWLRQSGGTAARIWCVRSGGPELVRGVEETFRRRSGSAWADAKHVLPASSVQSRTPVLLGFRVSLLARRVALFVCATSHATAEPCPAGRPPRIGSPSCAATLCVAVVVVARSLDVSLVCGQGGRFSLRYRRCFV